MSELKSRAGRPPKEKKKKGKSLDLSKLRNIVLAVEGDIHTWSFKREWTNVTQIYFGQTYVAKKKILALKNALQSCGACYDLVSTPVKNSEGSIKSNGDSGGKDEQLKCKDWNNYSNENASIVTKRDFQSLKNAHQTIHGNNKDAPEDLDCPSPQTGSTEESSKGQEIGPRSNAKRDGYTDKPQNSSTEIAGETGFFLVGDDTGKSTGYEKHKHVEQRTEHSEDCMVPGKDVLPDASINKSLAANGEDETQQSDEGMSHGNGHFWKGNLVIRKIWDYLMLQVIPIVRWKRTT